ncbi:UNVERIFIED_CONTAM: hypothetical protein HDU68_011882 [Siphonaria sp. JEL0065]|nr:hypothetical protein HDU68_011882 [Siphonaria sp. JEL0065]
MSSKPSKREAERNLRQLQTLTEIPENRQCADCNDPKPKWASSNIGVFLCIRCAGLHRNMGREISVIKSITLDSWSEKEIETMTNIGNRRANALYLANGPAGPPAPTQKDMAKFYLNSGMMPQGGPTCSDKEMYRFIKDKYKKRIYMRDKDRREIELKEARENRGSGSSSNRAGSNSGGNSSGHSRQKENITIEPDDHVTFSGQLKLLSSMGFTDTTKCLIALKRSKANVDAAIDLLVSKPDELVLSSISTKEAAAPLQAQSKPEELSKVLQDALNFLSGMGFNDREENLSALRTSKGDVDQAVNILVQLQSSKPAAPPSHQSIPQQPQSNFSLDLLSLSDVPVSTSAGASGDPFGGFFGQPPIQQQQQQFEQYQDPNQFGQFQQQQPVQQQTWVSQPTQFQQLQQPQQFMQMQNQQQFQPQQPQQQANFGSNTMAQFQPVLPQSSAQTFGSVESPFGSLGQTQQPLKPNYNIGFAPSTSVFNKPSALQQNPTPLKNDPFAALVKESNMMPQQQQQSFNVAPVAQQQIPIGMMAQQQRQMSYHQPQYSAYSAAPQPQTALPFGGFDTQPQSQIPRNMMQPQQPQQQQQFMNSQQQFMQSQQQPQQQAFSSGNNNNNNNNNAFF